METTHIFSSAIIVGIALFAGTIAQIIARHINIPGIVLLLIGGALLGPDFAGVIDPGILGEAIQTLVGFAVAVILFEGGMNLNIRRLKRESRVIQQLVTLGAIVTAAGGFAAAFFVLNWSLENSLLFGTLVIVTGPTVIAPILRRIKLNSKLQTILEAEGVLIDPIGALIAIVTLEIIIHPSSSFFTGVTDLILGLGVGFIIGIIAGYILVLLLKPKRLIPDGMANIFVLTFALALFQVSNYIQAESGLGAVTIAGLVVGNFKTRALEDLMEFKEQLTVMLIGMLFIILAADVSLNDINSLGWAGFIVVGILIFIVRPVNILVGTIGSGLKIKEKIFLSWMAPRGIIAAAVASYFAIELEKANIPGGNEIRALVFLTIICTVVLNGLTGGPFASLLKLRRKANKGFIILGSNKISNILGKLLKQYEDDVIMIDSNPDASHAAEQIGLKVIFGNGLEERTLIKAMADSKSTAIGFTPNEEINLLFTTRCNKHYKVPNLFMVLVEVDGHITNEMIESAGAHVLFGRSRDVDLWCTRVRRKLASLEEWSCTSKEAISIPEKSLDIAIFPILKLESDKPKLIDDRTTFKKSDRIILLIHEDSRDKAKEWLSHHGWVFEKDIIL